jgi:SM-20-related protein
MSGPIKIDVIETVPVTHHPFDFFAVTGVLDPDRLADIRRDFPVIEKPGLYPADSVAGGPAFRALLDDVRSDRLRNVIEKKFDVALEGLPLMITVRGHAQLKDGRIHCDSKDKVITCLLYLNEQWDSEGGRLRMLHNDYDLETYAAEIPAAGGVFASFRVTPQSWHGHKPFAGERRYVMFNWIRSEDAERRHRFRHRLSQFFKSLFPMFYRGQSRSNSTTAKELGS